jgi:hypothetical protein
MKSFPLCIFVEAIAYFSYDNDVRCDLHLSCNRARQSRE